MAYLTEKQLKDAKDSYTLRKIAIQNFSESIYTAEKTIFLSHSHKDREHALGLKHFFANEGIDLYIDWQDSSMPRITNHETAIKIKDRIKELNFFMMLATENAINSKWVPWEVGVADSSKAYEKILIIPVKKELSDFSGSEYLDVYRRLEIENNVFRVFKPGFTYASDSLRDFLR